MVHTSVSIWLYICLLYDSHVTILHWESQSKKWFGLLWLLHWWKQTEDRSSLTLCAHDSEEWSLGLLKARIRQGCSYSRIQTLNEGFWRWCSSGKVGIASNKLVNLGGDRLLHRITLGGNTRPYCTGDMVLPSWSKCRGWSWAAERNRAGIQRDVVMGYYNDLHISRIKRVRQKWLGRGESSIQSSWRSSLHHKNIWLQGTKTMMKFASASKCLLGHSLLVSIPGNNHVVLIGAKWSGWHRQICSVCQYTDSASAQMFLPGAMSGEEA